MVAYVEEGESVAEGIFAYEIANGIGWFALEMAFLDVYDLVEEAAYVEAEALAVHFVYAFRVFAVQQPAAVREGEFELVPVAFGFLGWQNSLYFRHLQVTYAYELVFDLLLFCRKLHFVGEGLPFAPSADSEVLAEGFQPVRGGLYHPEDEAFHIVFLFLADLDVNYVSGNCELYENHCALYVSQGFAFGCNCFYLNVFKYEFLCFLSHDIPDWLCKNSNNVLNLCFYSRN